MINKEFSEAISEVLDILNHMEKIYIDKIPNKFKVFLEENKSQNYKSNLDHSKKLNEMELKRKTKGILSMIYLTYWCTSEEKAKYLNLLNENENKYQQEIRKKYNPDNIFKNSQDSKNGEFVAKFNLYDQILQQFFVLIISMG